MSCCVIDLRARAFADIPSDIDDINRISHIYLALVHVVQHLLGTFGPDFVVATMAEQADADDDVTGKSQALLRFQELFLEASAAAESPKAKCWGYLTDLADR